jgi:hypothetical protein
VEALLLGRKTYEIFAAGTRAWITAAADALDGTWRRARGIALHQAAALIPYYSVSNSAFAALGRRTVEQVVAGFRAD